MTDHERIERLERCAMTLTLIILGKPDELTPEEFKSLIEGFMFELECMKNGM